MQGRGIGRKVLCRGRGVPEEAGGGDEEFCWAKMCLQNSADFLGWKRVAILAEMVKWGRLLFAGNILHTPILCVNRSPTPAFFFALYS